MKKKTKLAIGAGLYVLASIWFANVVTTPPKVDTWERVTVTQGETIWGLCEQHFPSQVNVNDVVDEVCTRNHINGTIQPGETLWIPTQVS